MFHTTKDGQLIYIVDYIPKLSSINITPQKEKRLSKLAEELKKASLKSGLVVQIPKTN
jgi:hypothetical protein